MNRGDRLHCERRVKRMWLRRLLRFPSRMTEDWAAWAKSHALRKAHHNKCDCGLCTGMDQQRRRSANRRERQEARIALRLRAVDGERTKDATRGARGASSSRALRGADETFDGA